MENDSKRIKHIIIGMLIFVIVYAVLAIVCSELIRFSDEIRTVRYDMREIEFNIKVAKIYFGLLPSVSAIPSVIYAILLKITK